MQINGILETALYVADPAVTAAFYQRLFGFPTLLDTERLVALDVAGKHVLLLFRTGSTSDPLETGGGTIPGHEGVPPTHFAFAISAADVDAWQAKLKAEGVTIESIVTWSRGGTSIYFRDPDNNLAELVSPGLWATY